MKRVLPVIITLIALSLAGIIFFQLSWLQNLVQNQYQSYLERIEKAQFEVNRRLGQQVIGGGPLAGFGFGLTRRPTLSQRFTNADIYSRFREAFEHQGLHHLRFEYAITSDYSNYVLEPSLQSSGFEQEGNDTTHNKTSVLGIYPENSSIRESLDAFEHSFIVIPSFKTQVWRSLTWMIIGSALFTIILVAAFYVTVRTLFVQKRLSEIKSDFINNMTHEFKTPLATISLAVDALRNEKVQQDRERMKYFSSIIKEENIRMNRQVETILQAALMEKQELSMKLEPIHAHEVIRKVMDNFSLVLHDRKAQVELKLNAEQDLIHADEVHFANLLSNLIDNAIKYSKDDLVITVSTHCSRRLLFIRVEDNGIGMSKETVKRVFEKFFRAHTGNLHNVKGFGLGMSYVKTVIDAHHGKIRVESVLGKGSTFTVEMPVA